MNSTRRPRSWAPARARSVVWVMALVLSAVAVPAAAPSTEAASVGYSNPLSVTANGVRVETCADPSVIRGQTATDTDWYMYCTTDPLHSADRNASGNLNFHLIPMFSSSDLVNWTYEGDAFTTRPSYAPGDAGLWAPEIDFFNGQYYLYYTVTNTTFPGGGSAMGVATAPTPLGPWTHSAAPVIEPHAPDCCPDAWRPIFDPDVIEHRGQRYIYYGSYFGGISVRELSDDGMTSDRTTQTNVAIANRYEGAELVWRGGHWYLFVSATDCCRGELTGYSVFVGRSKSPLGPFVDREGQSLLAGRAGGTPVITMNGNRWVGLGHNTVIEDFDGQWWTFYHAIDQTDAWIPGPPFLINKRPVLLDPLDWLDGWPTVRGGAWASDEAMPGPAAQPGDTSLYERERAVLRVPDGEPVDGDEFDGATLGAGWSWVREPATGPTVDDGSLVWQTQGADLHEGSNNASVLLRDLPAGDWIVEARVRLDLPPEGCCFNFRQAGLVVYGDDDAYLKLVHVSIWETRQTEWAKEIPTPIANGARYGNTVVTSPAEWTWLRIARWESDGTVHYQAYTSRDGNSWNAGGVWNHDLPSEALGLVSMGGSGSTAEFDYVRVFRVATTDSRK